MFLNRDRAIKAMEERDLDALIASTSLNIQYLTDIPGIIGYAVLPREKNYDPFLITGIGQNDKIVVSDTWIKDIRFHGPAFYWAYDPSAELTDLEKKMKANVDSAVMDIIVPDPFRARSPSMIAELVNGLKERGLEKGRLGIEENETTITHYEKIRKALPTTDLVFADDAFAYARQVKTTDEIRLFEESVPIIDEGWKAICDVAKEGVTEGDLLKAFKKTVVSYGLEGAGVNYTLTLSIGRRSIMPFSGIGEDRWDKLERGDLIIFGGGIVYKNHPTHHARTAVLGEPKNSKVLRFYQGILDSENAGLEALKPGVKASDIYNIMIETARNTIPDYKRHHMGHSLGLGGYDTPNFMANDHTPLEENMVFNIEPSSYLEFGLGGLRLEDTLLITNSGYKLFTKTSRDIWRL